jgi:hypothetical protein
MHYRHASVEGDAAALLAFCLATGTSSWLELLMVSAIQMVVEADGSMSNVALANVSRAI